MFHQVFDQIYVINLLDRVDRRAEILDQFRKIGVDSSSTNVQFFPAVRPPDSGEFPTLGARGCFMSHLGILKDASEKSHTRILILEDDCNFTRLLRDRWLDFRAIVIESSWSLMYGGNIERTKYTTSLPIKLQANPVPADQGIGGTHFLAIQGEAIARAATYLESMLARPPGDPMGGPMHVDGAYSWFRRSNPQFPTLMCDPQIAYQRASRTDIHEGWRMDALPGWKSLLPWLRTLKNRMTSDL